mgnify:FL=1|jgi:NAD(P)-dependent dehydrogenase (short-subunit alcohol dehydrogenase family)
MSGSKTTDIPAQGGRTAVITGTGGLGYEAALVLAQAGADVIIAGRNPSKGEEAVARVQRLAPNASIQFEQLDLANLQSIEAFGTRLRAERGSLDLLINNAAVMAPPKRKTTDDGFELQFGTNYLGHFALTAQLLPLLRKSRDARVVTLSSIASRDGKINFEDLQAERGYKPMAAYSQSKLACLMFALELQRRSEADHWGLTSVSAHPGVSRTDLLHNGAGPKSTMGLMRTYLWFLFQPAAHGAWPILHAATSSEAKAGAYYGPNGFAETRGLPALAKIPTQAKDTATAARLWDLSERLCGAPFQVAQRGGFNEAASLNLT